MGKAGSDINKPNSTTELGMCCGAMDLPVVPLHKHPQYLMQCCQLINEEWERSTSARMHSLERSCDSLPTSLILLKDSQVIGHCKLSVIPSITNSCFVESVVINKSLRGRGYGKYLMLKVEEYCKDILNLKTIYLSTKGQELFYSKLGYDICQPISIYGSASTVNFSNYSNTSYIRNIPKRNTKEAEAPKAPPMLIPSPSSSLNIVKVYMKKMF